MPHEAMSPRERWLAVLQRRKPDRVPMDYWATAEATQKLLKHLGCADERVMCDHLHIDLPITVSPRYAGPPIPDDAVRRIVPDMIEAGIDARNPIQWRCPGMEREALVRDFGGRIIFHETGLEPGGNSA
jgi:hypothetical protein